MDTNETCLARGEAISTRKNYLVKIAIQKFSRMHRPETNEI